MITVTQQALSKVSDLLVPEENPELKLRVFVTGGGCSGLSYGFTFDESKDEEDILVTYEECSVLIDSVSYQYMSESEIDYQEDLNGSRFVVNNPDAIQTCDCKKSFAL